MINVWTPFDADKSILAGGAALGQGIGRGLESLGQSIGKALEEKKRKGQLATSIRKTLSVAYPDRKDEFATMGLPDLQGALEGEAMKRAEMRAKLTEDVQRAQLGEFLAKQNERQSMTDIAGQLSQQGQAPENVPAPFNNAEFSRRTAAPDLMSAIAKLGPGRGIEPRAAADLADSIARMRAAGAPDEEVNFVEDPETGERFATFGKSMASSGVNPTKARPKPTAPIQPRVVVSRDPMTQLPIISWSGSPDDFKKQFPNAKLPVEAEAVAATATTADAPAQPKSKAEYDALPSGSYYIDPATQATKRKK